MNVVVALSVLTVLALAIGFAFGRNYEAALRKPKPRGVVLDLHPSDWERVT